MSNMLDVCLKGLAKCHYKALGNEPNRSTLLSLVGLYQVYVTHLFFAGDRLTHHTSVHQLLPTKFGKCIRQAHQVQSTMSRRPN